MLIDWGASLETGIDWLDRDHRRIIELANQLAEVLKDTHTEAAVNGLIDDVCGYFAHHFAEEEAMMDRMNYPDEREHKADQLELIATLDQINGLRQRDAEGCGDLALLVLNWLASHLNTRERDFAAFLRAGSIANPAGA